MLSADLPARFLLIGISLLAVGPAYPDTPSTFYRLGGSIFEDRTSLNHQVETSFTPKPAWTLSAYANQSGTRYADSDYSSDSHHFDLALVHSLNEWALIEANLDAQRSTYVRNSRVDQDVQNFHLVGTANIASGVKLQGTLGSFWFRNRDEGSGSISVQSNKGLESELLLKTRGEVLGNATWNGSLALSNQFLADFPSTELDAKGSFHQPGPGLNVDIEFEGNRERDYPISEALRGFEERLSDSRKLSTTVGRWFFGRSLLTETELSVDRSRREYLDQPQKDRLTDDDNLAGVVSYQPGDSLSLSIELERGYRREVDALTADTSLERRIERRSIEADVDWRLSRWLRMNLFGSRSLHQTDHRGSPNQDDGDDLDDVLRTSVRLRPFGPFVIFGGISGDWRKERHLNAKWAAFSLDRGAYLLNSGFEYEVRDDLKMYAAATLVSTLSEYLYTPDESTFLLERRASGGVDWETDGLVMELFGQLQYRTTGDLVRGPNGDLGILPTREERISTLDTYIERELGDWGTIDLDWSWRQSAVRGLESITKHEAGVSLLFKIKNRSNLSITAEDIYRPADDARRHQLTLRARLSLEI